MSAEPKTVIPATCPNCGAALTRGETCPRCLFGDVLAVLDGPVPPTAPPPGGSGRKQVGEYELLEELGRGGMGVVWKARQRRLNRIVALKLVRGGCLPGEAAAKRFRREAEAAAQLRHPNIVVIHEVGESDEQLYLSMDLVEGGSLADWLKRVAFSPTDAASLVAKVARGVHHAHENQILHRDLKPANILLNSAGEPLVCDFGLARLGDAESSLTLSGELLGTPAYLSPEQASGKMRDLTPASDTYSLGSILYELLCGHPPFSAENIPALLRKVAEDDPLRPNSHFSGSRVPFDLSTICLKCLEKEPAARYPSALALAEDLERWFRGEPILARPVARAERVWKWVRRKPVLAALWFTITALTVVVAAVASVMSVRLGRERQAVAALAESSHHQVARQLSESAQRYISGGDYLRALPALAEAIRVGTGDPRLDEADRIRFGVLLRTSPTLKQAWLRGLEITRAEATADGERLLIVTPKTAEVWSTSTGQRIGQPLEVETIISSVQFDGAGSSVLVEANQRLFVWEPATGVKRDVGDGQIFAPADASLEKGANFVGYLGKKAEVRAFATGARVGEPIMHPADVEWAISLPDSDRVLSSDINGVVYLWEVPSGTLIGEPLKLGRRKRPINFGAYDRMQNRVVLHRERDCWSIDCRTGALVGELLEAEDTPQTLGFDEHGNWLFLARNNEGLTLRYLLDGTIRWSWLHYGLGFRGSFAPAVGMVATQSWNGSTRVWRLSNGRPTSPFLWQTATPGSCILDPQGRWLLTRGDEPAARLWKLRDDDGATALPGFVDNPVNAWFASGPERVYVVQENGTIGAWEKEPPHRKLGEVFHPGRAVTKAEPAAGGTRFFTAGANTVQAWDMQTWKPVGPRHSFPESFIDVTMDPGGNRFAVVLPDGRTSVRDVSTGEEKAALQTDALTVSFSVDGRRLLAVGPNSAQVWDPATGEPISPEVEHVGQTNAKLSPDGTRVLQWGGRESTGQAHATIWDAATGRKIRRIAAHWQGIGGAAWSPDGSLIATGGADQTLLLSDVATGAPVLPPIKHGQKISAVGFSNDGRLMWSLAEKEITVWSTVSGEPVTPRLRQSRVPVAITIGGLNGRDLAVAGFRSTPRIWHLNPDLRPPVELQRIAHALSAHALVEGTSALRPLTLVESRATWEAARQLLGAW